MVCPVCQVELKMSERQGVEIDYCPQCRGVWLDRGELDKILERSAAVTRPTTSEPRRDDDDYHEGDYRKSSKRKSFLDELFDF
ncbi:MAG TPA: zf-TFIIB domain-containing protein [Phototrophicaceae bacterium]|nr:zf-TFIIB domain-containing protein [Phototrophicaceae bacterium]